MRVTESTIRSTIEEAVNLGLTAFETSVIAQLAGIERVAAEDGLSKLHLANPRELALEIHLTCPRDDCNRQLMHEGFLASRGTEIICPFCSTSFIVGPAAGHSLWVPKGKLAERGPRLVAVAPYPRSRLSPLAERSLTRTTVA